MNWNCVKWGAPHVHDAELACTPVPPPSEASSDRNTSEEAADLAFVLQETGFGLWRYDVVRDCFELSPGWRASLGLRPDELRTVAQFKALLHPDDVPSVEAALERALEGAGDYVVEHRFLERSGEVRWVLARGRVSRACPERPIMTGVAVDITAERMSLLESLKRSEERYRLAALATDNEIYEWDIRTNAISVHRLFSHAHETQPVWSVRCRTSRRGGGKRSSSVSSSGSSATT